MLQQLGHQPVFITHTLAIDNFNGYYLIYIIVLLLLAYTIRRILYYYVVDYFFEKRVFEARTKQYYSIVFH